MPSLATPLDPSRSRSDMATSDTTYHSFHDIDVFAPDSPPKAQPEASEMPQKENRRPEPTTPMKRQDSGYESIPPRHSMSSSTGGKRRISNASCSGSARMQTQAAHTPVQSPSRTQSRPCSSRGRPTIRRSPKTSPYPMRSTGGKVQALYAARALPDNRSPLCPSRQSPSGHSHSGFFHFPIHPTDLEAFPKPPSQSPFSASVPIPVQPLDLEPESPSESLPPQSTHYWTSDRTRRLEYAAIDAAHRGLKGWIRRHLVPSCFLPKEKEHVAFDDDTGSVRRYRLELDEECAAEKSKKPSAWGRIKSW